MCKTFRTLIHAHAAGRSMDSMFWRYIDLLLIKP
jgi:hypothetical protein